MVTEVRQGTMPTWGPIHMKPSILLTDTRAVDISSPVLLRVWTLKVMY
jgi:cytochrome c551/c552